MNTHGSCCRKAEGGWRTEKGELSGVSANCLTKKAAGTVFGIGSAVGDAKDGDEKRQLLRWIWAKVVWPASIG